MDTLVKDVLKLDILAGFRRLTNAGGLDNTVTKVGILDYEMTTEGKRFIADEHWEKGEFVLTTFGYAKNRPELITYAIKRMCNAGTSGIAIKNVYQTGIPEDAIRYANAHAYPIFVLTDHSLYFEDVIIAVNQLIAGRHSRKFRENEIAEILFNSCDSKDIERKSRIVVPFLSNKYQVLYMLGRSGSELSVFAEQAMRSYECEAVRYREGEFLFINQPDHANPVEFYLEKLGIRKDSYYLGSSEIFFFRSRLRKAMMQAIYAARFSQMSGKELTSFKKMGMYQFLFPNRDNQWIEDYYSAYIPVINEFDTENNTNLLETALLYEKYDGNLKAVAADQNTHTNTIRYRMKKLEELFQEDLGSVTFESRLMVAIKIFRMRQFCDQIGDMI